MNTYKRNLRIIWIFVAIVVIFIMMSGVIRGQGETAFLEYSRTEILDEFGTPHYEDVDPLNKNLIYGYYLGNVPSDESGRIEFDFVNGRVKFVRVVFYVLDLKKADESLVTLGVMMEASGLQYKGKGDKVIHTNMYQSEKYTASTNYYTPDQLQAEYYMIVAVLTKR